MMKNEEQTSPISLRNQRISVRPKIPFWRSKSTFDDVSWWNSLGFLIIQGLWRCLWWKIGDLMVKMENWRKEVGFRWEEGRRILKSAETRLRFCYIRGRIVSRGPRIRHGSYQSQQKHRRPLRFVWARMDPSADQWIRGRIFLGFLGSELVSLFLCTNCRNCNFSNFFSLFRPIPNHTLDKLFINSNLPRTCNIP